MDYYLWVEVLEGIQGRLVGCYPYMEIQYENLSGFESCRFLSKNGLTSNSE